MSDSDLDPQLAALVVEHAPCWLLVIDGQHKILLTNPAFTERFGTAGERPCYAVVKGRDAPCDGCVALAALQSGALATAEERADSEDPDAPSFTVRAIPLDEGEDGEKRILLLALDRTRESSLARELGQVERLAAVGLTTTGLAHTIKNILAGLEGGKYMMTSGLQREDSQRIAGAWEMVEKYLEQVGDLVGNMLRYASSEAPKHEAVQPDSIIDDVLELYQSRAGMIGISVEREVPSGLTPVTVDAAGVHSCLANFVANAIDACAWDPDSDKDHRIVVSAAARDGGGVVISVTDNGKGIPLEDQPKILRASFTTKGIRGTGLGLLLSKKMIDDHGGRIDFQSTPGQGSTFTIELPSHPPAAPSNA